MKSLRYCFVFVGVVLATSMFAQNITPNQLKQIRSAVYNWVDSYLEYSYLSSEYDINKYRSLFANNQVSVVNDYLPITEDERIAIQEYSSLYLDPSTVYNAYPHTYESSIVIQDEEVTSKSYKCVLTVNKSISFSDEERKYEYPKKEYTLYITLECNFKEQEVLCTDIYTSDKLSVEYILHQESDSITNRYIDKTDTVALLKNTEHAPVIISKYMYHYHFDDKVVEVRRDTTKNNFHFGALVGPSFYSSAFFNTDFYNHSQKTGLAAGINLGFYHQLYLKGNNRIGIEYGASFNRNTFRLLGDYKTQYNAVDPDGGNYLRLVNAKNFYEQLQLISVSIPLCIRYDYFINPNLSVFGGIGAYASYDLFQQSQVSVDVEYAGYYDWLFDVTINQNGIYDFGLYHQDGTTHDINLNKLNVGVFLNIGCQYFIPKSNWSVEPSIRYQTSLFTPTINDDSDFHLLERDGEVNSVTNLFKSIYKHNVAVQLNFNYHF